MVESVRRLIRHVAFLNRVDQTGRSARGMQVDNVDALAASGPVQNAGSQFTADSNFPPGYVKSYDEGRPRK
jgi:hypothetical protein